MEDIQGRRVIEAILFVSGQPVTLKRLLEIVPEIENQTLRRLVDELNAEYLANNRAFRIQEIAGGYQLVTDQALAAWVKRALDVSKPDSVSVAAMETLAIVAYRQPVTKAEVEAIRGVDITASLDTLLERRFIRVAGRKDTPGRPYLYGTTGDFLRHFGLKSIEALPEMPKPSVPEHAEQTSSGPVAPQDPGAIHQEQQQIEASEPAQAPGVRHGKTDEQNAG